MGKPEGKEMYQSVCRPQLEQLSTDVGVIKTKIFNGHSTSIENIEKDVSEIKKLILGMLFGTIGILASIVVYQLLGISI